ncbi:MAG: hypothetical protein ACOX6H_03910 [Christensenellales bacterium]|jgi:hypothetical protein
MKGLKTLVLMQLKDKIDLSFVKSFKKTLFKVVLSLIKFVAITFIIYMLFNVLSTLRLVSILPGIPQSFLVVVFTIMFLLSIFVCTFGLMKSLYFSKDNALLLTMPTDRLAVFTSKIIVYYIYELIRNITFILPLFLAYGFINKMPIYFYFWLVLMLVVLTALSVSVGTLLSIPAMQIAKVIKTQKWLEYTLVVVIIGAIVFGLVTIINAIPLNFNIVATWGTTFWRIQNFMEAFGKIFAPFSYVVTAVVGQRIGIVNTMFGAVQWLSFLSLVLVIGVVLLTSFIIVKPVFFHMVSSPFEFKKKETVKQIPNKKKSFIWSAVRKDLSLTYRTPEKFYGLIFIVLGLPIAILLLNKLYAAMDTRLTGTYMTLAFNILIILLFALSSNVPLSHIFSEEGASSYLLKTFPKQYLSIASVKLIFNAVLVGISLLVSVIIFASFSALTIVQTIVIYLALLAVYLAHMLWVVESDVMNPQTQQYQTTGGHTSNPNETKATLKAVLLSVFFAFVVYFLIPENRFSVWYKLLLVAVLFLGFRIWIYINKVNLYFKERE